MNQEWNILTEHFSYTFRCFITCIRNCTQKSYWMTWGFLLLSVGSSFFYLILSSFFTVRFSPFWRELLRTPLWPLCLLREFRTREMTFLSPGVTGLGYSSTFFLVTRSMHFAITPKTFDCSNPSQSFLNRSFTVWNATRTCNRTCTRSRAIASRFDQQNRICNLNSFIQRHCSFLF